MNSFKTQGSIVAIMDEQVISDKFRKREFAIEIPDGTYPQTVKFQLTQDKCDLLNGFSLGNTVEVDFNLSGKPFVKNGETMYFNNLQAWRLTNAGHSSGGYNAQPQTSEAPSFYSSDADNDLPF
jgi:single-strand DNA-binding protein